MGQRAVGETTGTDYRFAESMQGGGAAGEGGGGAVVGLADRLAAAGGGPGPELDAFLAGTAAVGAADTPHPLHGHPVCRTVLDGVVAALRSLPHDQKVAMCAAASAPCPLLPWCMQSTWGSPVPIMQ